MTAWKEGETSTRYALDVASQTIKDDGHAANLIDELISVCGLFLTRREIEVGESVERSLHTVARIFAHP